MNERANLVSGYDGMSRPFKLNLQSCNHPNRSAMQNSNKRHKGSNSWLKSQHRKSEWQNTHKPPRYLASSSSLSSGDTFVWLKPKRDCILELTAPLMVRSKPKFSPPEFRRISKQQQPKRHTDQNTAKSSCSCDLRSFWAVIAATHQGLGILLHAGTSDRW